MQTTHPTPDQRRAEAVEQATGALDGNTWPQPLQNSVLYLESENPEAITTRHAELLQTIQRQGNLLRSTLVKIFITNWVVALLILLAYFIFAAAAPAARAQQLSLLAHQISYHTDRTQDFNEVNPGLGVQYRPQARPSSLGDERSDVSASPWSERVLAGGYVQAGFYKNSYRRQTFYAAVGSEPFALGPVRLGAFVAAGTGYGKRTVTVTTTEQVRDPLRLIACPTNKPCPPTPTVTQTTTTERTEPTNALRAAAGLSASLQGQRFGLQFVAMPPLRVNGNTLSSGVFAASLMVRI